MKNWIKKNILAETPIIGGFFKEKGCSHAWHHAAKMVCQLTGSAIATIFYMENNPMAGEAHTVHYAESLSPYYAKMIAYMALGDMIGAVTYNAIVGAVKFIHNAYIIKRDKTGEKRMISSDHRSDQSELDS